MSNMILFLRLSFTLLLCSMLSFNTYSQNTHVDVLVVGGGASGIAAGTQSARMGSRVAIIEESAWLGGMLTAAGVSAIDGNYKLPSGFWGEFRDSLVCHYGSLEALKTGWVSSVLFEPSVGNQIFQNIASAQNNLTVYQQYKLTDLIKTDSGWSAQIEGNDGSITIEAQVVIDATELGDVAKRVGIEYEVGMDSRYDTKESIAPEEANEIIQDLTYVAVLKDYGKDVTIDRPLDYDSTQFLCAAINDLCVTPKEPDRMWSSEMMITYGKLPNNKYMINWPLEGNDFYLNLIDVTEEQRIEALKKAKNFTQCFLYFIQKQLGYNTLGLADDEFPTSDLLPFIPYHRESRRINGEVQFTLNHIADPYTQEEKLYRTSIAVGDYPVDQHHSRYEGYDSLPNFFYYEIPSYGLPLGVMIPQKVDDIIVAEKSLSVTNLVNGTTRLQPVVLQVGQVAGILASLATKEGKQVREVSVRDVQRVMLANGGYLLPYLDVDKTDQNFMSYQRIGVTGILQGMGKTVGWSNETWLRINDPLLFSELSGLTEMFPAVKLKQASDQPMTYADAKTLVASLGKEYNITQKVNINELLNQMQTNEVISRGEFAVLLDRVIDPFNLAEVTLKGEFKK